MLLNLINNEKYCHKSVGNTFKQQHCQSIVIGIDNSFYEYYC